MKDDRHIIWSNHNLDFDDWRDELEEQYCKRDCLFNVPLIVKIKSFHCEN